MTIRKPWAAGELALLREQFPCRPTQQIAAALGRSLSAVFQRAHKLGLRKSEAHLHSELAGRIQRGRTDSRMLKTQFRPGQRPWNKGLHYQPGGRAKDGQFKPGTCNGRAAQLVQPVGAYRVNADGYLDRKVSDEPGLQSRRWRPVHCLVWEAAHGPIPPGHVVAFLPGRRSVDPGLITLDALELITRQELMRRNSVHTIYPPEIARVAQLRGAINRQINKRTKEAT